MEEFKILSPPLRDERGILEPWEDIVVSREVRGKLTHDARLVAAMKRHGLTHLLTFNVDDFKRFPEIELLNPATLTGTSI